MTTNEFQFMGITASCCFYYIVFLQLQRVNIYKKEVS